MLDSTNFSQEIQAINNYLMQVIQHSYKCAHCRYSHNGTFCFFAYECVKNDFANWAEED